MLKQWQKVILLFNVAFVSVYLLTLLFQFAYLFDVELLRNFKYEEEFFYASITPSLLAPIFCGLGLLFVLFVLYRSSFQSHIRRMLLVLLSLNVVVFVTSSFLLGGFFFVLGGGEGGSPPPTYLSVISFMFYWWM